jgi:hypothetical protein
MSTFTVNVLKGIRQWAKNLFWQKDETTYSEWGFYDAGTQAIGKTIVTPLLGNIKKVTLAITSAGTRDGWGDMYYRLPYVPNIRLETTWFGYYNGTDFRITLATQEGQPVIKLNHIVNGTQSNWGGETVAFAIEYVTIISA